MQAPDPTPSDGRPYRERRVRRWRCMRRNVRGAIRDTRLDFRLLGEGGIGSGPPGAYQEFPRTELQGRRKLEESTLAGEADPVVFEPRNLRLAHAIADAFGELLLRQPEFAPAVEDGLSQRGGGSISIRHARHSFRRRWNIVPGCKSCSALLCAAQAVVMRFMHRRNPA